MTCTDPEELVAFTPVYGASSPAGAGAEAVLDASGRVTELRGSRGTAIPAGGRTVQATGTAADWLRSHARPGTRLAISERVLDRRRPLRLAPCTSILGAGPRLVRDGRVRVGAYADGLVHTGDDRSFYYNWVLRRNPRTMVGVDRHGRRLHHHGHGGRRPRQPPVRRRGRARRRRRDPAPPRPRLSPSARRRSGRSRSRRPDPPKARMLSHPTRFIGSRSERPGRR
ncbi:phosphodiester glycosidase family protein [Actinomadura sp. NTSP31]|uniref:phosphodiester glycosidase family protein n=1 Tax=Actinomadura sp. NTSP31 TaxID=1735447 RepID=UPI0035BFEC99